MDEKTYRSDDNLIPSQMNDDATYVGDKTIISSGMNTPNVNAAINDATVRLDNPIQSDFIGSGFSQPDINADNTYMLNDKPYKFVKHISSGTGEADILLVEGEQGKAVLKVYRSGQLPKSDLIQKLRSIKHDDIIKVFDYGYIKDRFGERFFELMEYAEGGALVDAIPIKNEKRIKQIVKEIINALKFLHENGIVHRDIKPENIYFKDKKQSDLVIADFGISSIIDNRIKHHITTMKGTDFYSAPEGLKKVRLASNNVKISGAVDYYALGITLLVTWMSKQGVYNKIIEVANLQDIVDLNEKYDEDLIFRAWNELKEKCVLPFADDMPERIKTLISGLMVINEEKRWGYDECIKWLNGENVPVYKDVFYNDYEPFAFDDGQIASNPEELALFMQNNLKLAEKYLLRGKIKDWLEKAKNIKLATIIEDIAENIYKNDKAAAVQATIYALNPNLPYLDVDGNKCFTIEDLANAIEDNFEEYKNLLKNRNDALYVYIDSKGYSDLSDAIFGYYKEMKNNPGLATIYAIYHLNPKKPYLFFHPEKADGTNYTSVPIDNLPLLGNLFLEYMEEAKEYMLTSEIEAWFSFNGNNYYYDAFKYLREQVGPKNKDAMVVGAAYILNKEFVYTAVDKSNNKTKADIAQTLLKNFDKYTDILSNDFSYLHMYAWAKEWDWELAQIRYSFNFKSHNGKLFPYNKKIALMRVIKAFNKNFVFEIEGEVFKHPKELINASNKVKDYVKKELKNLDSKIHAWISVYFHEDPYVKFNKTGEYEDKLKEYMDFIELISPNNSLSKKYSDAKNSIPKLIKKEQNLDARFFIGQGIAIALPIVMAYFLFMYVYPDGGNQNLPGKFWDLPSWYFLTFAVLGIIFVFLGGDADFSAGCIGGPIVGAVVGIVLYYIFYFVVSSYYITGGLILIILGYALYDIIKNGNSYTSKDIRQRLFDTSDKLTFEWQPLAFAFSNKDKFDSPRIALLNDYHMQRKQDKIYILKKTIIPILVFATVLILLLSFDKKYDIYFTATKEFIKSIFLWVKNLF